MASRSKIVSVLASPWHLWMKDNKTAFTKDLGNGVALYVLFVLYRASGHMAEAAGLAGFVFGKMVFLIYASTLMLSLLLILFSFVFKGLILDKILLYACSQLLSLTFFTLTALTIAFGFYMLSAVVEMGSDYQGIKRVAFILVSFVVGSYLYVFSSFLLRRSKEILAG